MLQVDKGISPEVVRSILAERANLPCLAAKSAYKVSNFVCFSGLDIFADPTLSYLSRYHQPHGTEIDFL